MHESVPLDVGAEIHELSDEGIGRNQISAYTGVPSTTVKRVLSGLHQSYSDQLSARQVQRLINEGFRI